jgi:hypothetical protein
MSVMKLTSTSRRHAGLLPRFSRPMQLLYRRIPAQQLGPTVIKQLTPLHSSNLHATYAASSIEVDAGWATQGSRRAPAAVDTITLPLDYYR